MNLYAKSPYVEPGFDLMQVVSSLSFPKPKLDAANAINHLRWAKQWNKPHQGSYHYGGITMNRGENRTRIKLSARKVLELLAGRISQEEFFRHEDVLALENPFDQALRGGKLIASFERSDEDDDDWLIFEMTGPDPAIAPFTLPQLKSKK